MLRSRANEITELVRALASRRKARVDAARARLTIIGSPAVECLVEALEDDNNTVRSRAMPLLALIQDPRGREPLVAMLLDRSPRLREIAARSLARFPSAETIAALNRTLDKERREDVRVAAVESLVDLYAAGQETAIRRVVDLLMDASEAPRLRCAAFALLPILRPSERRGILTRLLRDPAVEVRDRAARVVARGEPRAQPSPASMRKLVENLQSDDYVAWNAAVRRLGSCGRSAVDPLIAGMRGHAHDPEYCIRAGLALKALGPRRSRSLTQALDEVVEPLPLQVLVDVVGSIGEKSLIYHLKALLERLAARPRAVDESDGFDPMRRVRSKAHLELAAIGSRVAIRDLRGLIADREGRLELEAVAAVARIGRREELVPLLGAYVREDRFTKERIADAVRTILRRERIRRNNPMFRGLSRAQRLAFEAILTRGSPSAGRRRAASRAG